jgi:N-acetylmuramoyl-L-alanine amidase
LALKVREELKKAGLEVLLSRENDVEVPLKARIDKARRVGAEVLLSLHHNSAASPAAAGAETYYQSRRPESRRLAALVQEYLVRATGLADRGLKTRLREDGRDYYYLLREAPMPAAILEVAFLTSPVDQKRLSSPDFQEQAAKALATALKRFVAPPAPGPFPDVPSDHWAYQAVSWAAREGILSGYPDGRFHGSEPATRYELAAALFRLAGRPSGEKLADDQHQREAGQEPES